MKKELFAGLATVLMIFSMFEIANADYVLSPDSYSISPSTVRVPRENDLSLSMNMTLTNTSLEILYLDDFSFDLFEWDSGGPSSYDFIQSFTSLDCPDFHNFSIILDPSEQVSFLLPEVFVSAAALNDAPENDNRLELIATDVTVTMAPVPIPGAIWLLGSGLAGVAVFRRKLVNS